MIPEIRAALERGLKLVTAAQLPGGGFLSFTAAAPEGHQATFLPSLISLALADVPAADPVRRRVAQFLLQEKSPDWSFNYWSRRSPQYQTEPYPDDLDDTFCALAALQLSAPAQITPAVLAQAIKLLVAVESAEGGPYYTWLSSDPGSRDVDVAVNANIAHFLKLHDVSLPNLVRLAEQAITARSYTTPYYPFPLTVMYFLSRCYGGVLTRQLRADIWRLQRPDGNWGNATATALAITALLNAGEPAAALEPAGRALAQLPDWGAQPVYMESRGHAAWAPALTAALVCEALQKLAAAAAARPARSSGKPQSVADRLYAEAKTLVSRRFAQLDADFQASAQTALGRLIRQDHDRQIILLPYVWQAALRPARPEAARRQLVELGAANLFGWIAYTIYDDFLDEEGRPGQLPVANVALRAAVELFNHQFSGQPSHCALLSGLLDEIESANAWELAHCRADISAGYLQIAGLPDYGDFSRLAGRSLGHALGPVALMLGRGLAPSSAAVKQTLVFFRHYLIARQLNDDVHDWESDLRRGHVNAVGAWLLRTHQPAAPEPLPALIETLKHELWQEQIVPVCEEILRQAAAARQALSNNPQIARSAGLAVLLEPLEAAARQALEARAATLEFLGAFQKSAGQ